MPPAVAVMMTVSCQGAVSRTNWLKSARKNKKESKTNAVVSQLPYDIGDDNVHVGPSDYVPWLKDRKWCHIRIDGTTFGEVPLKLDLKLELDPEFY